MSSIAIPVWRRGSWLLCYFVVCCVCTNCHGLFPLPLYVIGRLCSNIVTLPRHLLDYFSYMTNMQVCFQMLLVVKYNLQHNVALYSHRNIMDVYDVNSEYIFSH